MSEKEKEAEGLPRKGSPVLVEFKAPREFVEEFDLKWRSRFSSRSEAIRFLIRASVDEVSKNPEYAAASVGEGV